MLILASASPRRTELLTRAGIEHTVCPADIDESVRPAEAPLDYALRLAKEKALAVDAPPGDTVLAADTIVVSDGEIMGKPRDVADATRMLRKLSGQRHEVITGVCLRRGDTCLVEAATTAVWFAPVNDEEIAWYVASGDPMDKAGAYGIQGLCSRFITKIEGSHPNVVGLPVALVYRMLGRL